MAASGMLTPRIKGPLEPLGHIENLPFFKATWFMELALHLISSAFKFKMQEFTLPSTMREYELVLIKLYLKRGSYCMWTYPWDVGQQSGGSLPWVSAASCTLGSISTLTLFEHTVFQALECTSASVADQHLSPSKHCRPCRV